MTARPVQSGKNHFKSNLIAMPAGDIGIARGCCKSHSDFLDRFTQMGASQPSKVDENQQKVSASALRSFAFNRQHSIEQYFVQNAGRVGVLEDVHRSGLQVVFRTGSDLAFSRIRVSGVPPVVVIASIEVRVEEHGFDIVENDAQQFALIQKLE